MISVKHLKKTYKSKNKFDCVALDGTSFDLPDSGMVFILGKSGSGKSTLLNMLGGLDSFDSGEICVDGANLSQFSQKDYYDYRGNYVGFVFQDYHLLDELTIEQNIALNLDISAIEHGNKIALALQKVDMAEYATRYPQELSGGQKQRIATARAICKDPAVILCDEPTGNLDANTSKQILDLLKQISSDKLVLIVSHNVNDAQKYADRIIELADGKIYRDVMRTQGYTNEFRTTDGTLLLPHNDNLTDSQIDYMVDGIKTGKITKVLQNGDGFEQTKPLTQQTGIQYKGTKTKMSAKKLLKLSAIFARRKKLSFILTAVVAMLIISCFAVFQSFLAFDGNKAVAKALAGSDLNALVYQKGQEIAGSDQIDIDYLLPVKENEIADFVEAGYDGNIYKLYSHTIRIGNKEITNREASHSLSSNLFGIYLNETYGTLQCDKDFLTKLYGSNGELNVLAGDINQPNKGVIITDYIADCMMEISTENYNSYNDLIGYFTSYTTVVYDRIDAIIDTGYKQKYAKLIDTFKNISQNSLNYKKDLQDLYSRQDFSDFSEEVLLYLGISYTFSNDFIADMQSDIKRFEYTSMNKTGLKLGDKSIQVTNIPWAALETRGGYNFNYGETSLPYHVFNDLAGTTYTPYNLSTFTPCEVTFTLYSYTDETLYEKTFLVKQLSPQTYYYFDEQDILDLRPVDILPYALYFDDVSHAGILNNVAQKNHFMANSSISANASTLTNIIITFNDLFVMFELFLLVICVIYLSIFGTNIIRKNKYQIGVIKALGGKTNHIARMFITQVLVVGLMIFILSGVGIFVATTLANELLIASFREHLGVYIFNMRIINFIPHLALIDLVLILALAVLSCLAPLVAIHKIKPINIIKAKE